MANVKLSAITASGANPAATDNFVGVTAANADVLFTRAQLDAAIAATWANITGAPTTLSGYGITSPLNVAQGGTNLATLTAHAVMLGEGTGSVAFATIGTAGNLLIDQGAAADPSFNAMSGDVTITSAGAASVRKGAFSHPGYVSGSWYQFLPYQARTVASGTAPVVNTTYLYPVFFAKSVTVKALGVRTVTQGSVNNKLQIAIYNINPSTPNRPGTLVANSNTGDIVGSTGNVVTGSTTGNITLEGWFFAAISLDDTAFRTTTFDSGANFNNPATGILGSATAGNVLSTAATTLTVGLSTTAQNYNTWGDLTGATFAEVSGNLIPVCIFQVN
jgi:hypothetical protein